MAATANPVALQAETVLAFDAYIREAEAALEKTLRRGGSFLWSDGGSDRVGRMPWEFPDSNAASGRVP